MLQCVFTHRELFHKRIRVALRDVCLGGGDGGLLSQQVVTVLAAALRFAEIASSEALAVQFEALRAIALALVRQRHRLERQLNWLSRLSGQL